MLKFDSKLVGVEITKEDIALVLAQEIELGLEFPRAVRLFRRITGISLKEACALLKSACHE